jgi:hypothetical protein
VTLSVDSALLNCLPTINRYAPIVFLRLVYIHFYIVETSAVEMTQLGSRLSKQRFITNQALNKLVYFKQDYGIYTVEIMFGSPQFPMTRNPVFLLLFLCSLSLEEILASGGFENSGNRFCRQDKKLYIQ